MWIRSLSLYKHKYLYLITVSLLIFTVALSGAVSVVSKIHRNDLFFVSADAIPGAKIVIVDAGHGGEDSGAVGCTGVFEKDLNLAVAKKIGEHLEKEGYIVIYTRLDDKLLYGPDEDIKGIRKISDLKNRCKIADGYPESLFVSIHMNSFGDSSYSGLQVYYSEKNQESRPLSESVQNSVRERLQPENNRKTKAGRGIYVLENISNNAILIECGFLSNAEECKKLSEKEYQNNLSFSIVCGIIEYIEKTK